MTENEIIEYLKQNKEKGIAYDFMSTDVQEWCEKHKNDVVFCVYDRIAYAVENGDMSLFNALSEADKEYFRKHFEEWEGKHCVCVGARRDGAR